MIINKPLLIILTLCITLGSFIDEASLVAISLAVNGQSDSYLAVLYICNMLGAMAGARFAALLMNWVHESSIVKWLFIVQALMITLIYLASASLWVVALGFCLGAVGSVLWTVILSVVPLYCPKNRLDLANKLLQTISNLGSVAGPALVGIAYQLMGAGVLKLLAIASLLCGIGILLYHYYQPNFTNADSPAKPKTVPLAQNTKHKIFKLLRYPGVLRALLPLSVIIILTSTLNVLLIPYINTVLKFDASIFGLTLTMMSLGLLTSPFLVSGLFGCLGRVRGALFGASFMGLAMMVMATKNMWLILASGLMVGISNGVVNTLMGAFMMHTLGEHSKIFMPYYVLCLQSCVLMGFGLSSLVNKASIAAFLLGAGLVVFFMAIIGGLINGKVDPTTSHQP